MVVRGRLYDENPKKLRGQRSIAVQSKPDTSLKEMRKRVSDILLPNSIHSILQDAHHVTIVPASNIGTVPFVLLHLDNPNEYLIDKMSVSIAPDLLDLIRVGNSINAKISYESPVIVGNPTTPKIANYKFIQSTGNQRKFGGLAFQIGLSPGIFIGDISISLTAATGVFHEGTGFIAGGSIDIPVGNLIMDKYGHIPFVAFLTYILIIRYYLRCLYFGKIRCI